MSKQAIDPKEMMNSIQLITQSLFNELIDSSSEKTKANTALTSILRSCLKELPTELSRGSDIKKGEEDPHRVQQIPNITRYTDFSFQMLNIMDYIRIHDPLYLISFSQSNEKDMKLFSKSLRYVIVLAFYSIILSPELKKSRSLLNIFPKHTEDQQKMANLLSLDLQGLIEEGNKEILSDINNNIVQLGLKLILKRVSSKTEYRNKYKIIMDIIQNRFLFLTDYDNIDHFSFIRLSIEAVILSLNIYNKTAVINMFSDDKMRVKTIDINTSRKRQINFPFIVMLEGNQIKILLCIYEDKKKIDFLNERSLINNYQSAFEKESDITREIDLPKQEKTFNNPISSIHELREGSPGPVKGNTTALHNVKEISHNNISMSQHNQLSAKSPLNIDMSKKPITRRGTEDLTRMQSDHLRSKSPLPKKQKYNIFYYNLSNKQENQGKVEIKETDTNPITTNEQISPILPLEKTESQKFGNNMVSLKNIGPAQGKNFVSANSRVSNYSKNDTNQKTAETTHPKATQEDKPYGDIPLINFPLKERFFDKSKNIKSRLSSFLDSCNNNTHLINISMKVDKPIQRYSGYRTSGSQTKYRIDLKSPNRRIIEMGDRNKQQYTGATPLIYNRLPARPPSREVRRNQRLSFNHNTPNIGENVYNKQYTRQSRGSSRYVIDHNRSTSVRRYPNRGSTAEKKP